MKGDHVEEGPDLLGEFLILGLGHGGLAAFPKGVAGQGDFQSFPGSLIGGLEGARQFLAVVGETAGKEVDDVLATRADADSIAGSADELTQCHNG